MRTIFRLVLISLLWLNAAAQKSPYHIRNYKATEYNGFNQTWQGVQDEKGCIYIASTSAIYIYDGIKWHQTVVKKGAATRQLLYDSTSKIVYAGSVSDFGYIDKDSTSFPFFHSFTNQLNEKQAVFADVWKVHQQGKKIYFQSSERIFVVEGKKVVGVIEPWENSSFALMFNCGGHLYVRQRGVGLMEVSGFTLKKVENSDQFATTRLMGMLALDESTTLLLTGDKGFIKMVRAANSAATFAPFPIANDSFLTSTTVLGCKWISSDEFAVCSRNGLMIYTKDFVPKVLFDKRAGLLDESISEFFLDREKNIWVTHNNGCSMISYYVPGVSYTDQTGFTGTLEVAKFFGDTMYLGSSEGLFMAVGPFTTGGNLSFKRLPSRQTEVWNILPAGHSLLVSTTEGLTEYKNGTPAPLTEYYTNECMWIDSGRTVLTAEKGGFTILKKENNSWKEAKHYSTPGIELLRCSAPVRQKNNPAIVNFSAISRFKTYLAFTVNTEGDDFTFREYGPQNGLPAGDYYPLRVGDSTYLVGYFTAYSYRPALDKNDSSVCFTPAKNIFNALFSSRPLDIGRELNNRLFLEAPGTPYTIFFGDDGDGVYRRSVLLGDLFNGQNIQYGVIRNKKTTWILNQQELIQYNLERPIDTSVRFNALISRVEFAGDSNPLFFPGERVTLAYSRNSLKLYFSAPYFTYTMGVAFQYKLAGYDTAWSDFTRLAEKEYTNLPEGDYTFIVRARNAFGLLSEQAQFEFTVLPPWYRSVWAYGVYFILFISVILLSIYLGAQRQRAQKKRLEIIVAERTAEVVEQKQKIETQNFELESAYKGIQDSIHYAERIQHAILPVASEIRDSFPDSFVFFRPRDIVSGDFYWMVKRGAITWVACVDCTGHGVPGAFMSMIGNTLLNEIVLEKKIELPHKILDLLNIRVRQALRQDAGGETRDGMDISLCMIDTEKQKLSFAGANRALWIIRNKELLILPPDKFSIGGDQEEDAQRHFNMQEISLQKNDCIYMTSDGYADQFGGPRGKKFMVKRFQQLLMKIHELPMEQQGDKLEKTFDEWKKYAAGDGLIKKLEQVDDVLVLGFRII